MEDTQDDYLGISAEDNQAFYFRAMYLDFQVTFEVV